MNTRILWRSAVVQLVAVAVFFIPLAIVLPHSFFETWGWLTGPVAWMLCAAFTARVLDLPPANTLLGALLAGLPSALAVLIGLHTVGDVVSICLFALWCARRPRDPVPVG